METKKTKAYHSKAEWITLISEYRNQNQDKKVFCNNNYINVNTFSWWMNKLEPKATNNIKNNKKALISKSQFIPVKLQPSFINKEMVLELPNRIKINFPQGCEAKQLKLILEACNVAVR